MPIKGEQHGYTYKVLINGEWQEVTIQESPLELVERFEQDEEWTRVRHGYWISDEARIKDQCSVCGLSVNWSPYKTPYCPFCGAKMDEERR